MDFLWKHEYVIFNLQNYGGKRKERIRFEKIPYQSESNARNILAVNTSNHEILKEIQSNFC